VKKAYWRKDADGLSWLGRGLPQVTHKANYEWAEKETGIQFTKNPDLMLIMSNAVTVMFIGMIEGKFTGKKLSDYFDKDTDDAFNARRIINGTESAAKVAAYHAHFLRAVKAADRPGVSPPPIGTKPTSPLPPVSRSWVDVLLSPFRKVS
jgi:predicted chitinase